VNFVYPRHLVYMLLQSEGVLTAEEVSDVRNSYRSYLESELASAPSYVPTASMLKEHWKNIVWPNSHESNHRPETGVDKPILKRVGKASVAIPEGFVGAISYCY
jgi:probable 2-oxoglutarate dehydrogenase E1 component DHKTD1